MAAMTTTSDHLERLRTGVLTIPRADRATIPVSGADTLRYLHAVTTQHLLDRVEGEAPSALLLSAKGRIEFELRCSVLTKGVLIDTDAAAAQSLAERLARFVFRHDVEVGEPAAGAVTVAGPLAGATLQGAGLPSPDGPLGTAAVVGDGELVAVRTSVGVDLLGPAVAEAARALAAAGVPQTAASFWDLVRIEQGEPRWGYELTDDVLPEEAGLLDAYVHLSKGCYPGQETVARVHNLGQVQRRLTRLRFGGTALPAVRAELVDADGRRVGEVRSSVVHPELGGIGLGFVRRKVGADDTLHAGPVAATVVEPAVRPLPQG